MSKLTDYHLLCFDVYGTLIDWETGILTALEPLTSQLDSTPSKSKILEVYLHHEATQQKNTPNMPYSQLLATIHPQFAASFNLPEPSSQDSEKFGSSIGSWPAFPDTVDALNRLHKHYKLVVLSNVDKASFTASNAGPLGGVAFDRIITAQEVGSYKPDPRNFEYMMRTVKEELDVDKEQILQTAQSQFHDHHPAKKAGIRSVWIERRGTMGNTEEEVFDWKFGRLGEMADAVEREGRGC